MEKDSQILTPDRMQEMVDELEIRRGFTEETIQDKGNCLVEEVIEFFSSLEEYQRDPENPDCIEHVAFEGVDIINSVLMHYKRIGIRFLDAYIEKYNYDMTRG